ncbi:GGDEF domain-containing protein [Treponema sp.]|uniref:substrate-binding and GGDEF domain-containing protein n=1 Tax=Treponema sp. TaxID=166 RepID=UPI00298EC188|nr:GGDEF domain-containing protein [Treponema sp.]MCQ2241600.1 GGDEF domain-containing protein [Treponema sp.]
MKNLKFLVMTEEICSDYSRQVIDGICHLCDQKKISVVVCNVRHPKYSEGIFEYQYWAGAKLINVKDVDVVIVLSGIYFSSYNVEEFAEMLEPFKDKKIISLSQKLPIENSWAILSDNETIFENAFDFLVKKCGAKRIAFMDASKTSSVESQLRFNAYKKNLRPYQMTYDDSIVFHGKFTMNSAYEELEQRLGKDCTGVDFDAFIAANDQMALGAMAFFKDHGIKVPEQVKVLGYDDINEAAAVQPSLSSISPFNFNLGFNAAMTAMMIANGLDAQKEFTSPAKLVIRDSTGYEYCEHKKTLRTEALNQLILRGYDNTYIYYLLDTIQCNDALEVFLKRIQKTLKEVDIKKFALVLYDEPVYYKKLTEFKMPEKVKLEYVYENGEGKVLSGEYFSPEEHIVPPDVFDDVHEKFIAQSIYYGEKQYGYMLYSIGERGLVFYNLYAKALSNAIANSYEYTIQYVKNISLQIEKYELEQTSRTDELTGVLNRRGFDIQGQKQIDYAVTTGGGGVVFYGDMNGLKAINDTYGHEYGDKAIKAEAEILKSTFRASDTVGRMGGDEFAVVAAGFPMRKLDEVKKIIAQKCLEAKEKYQLPFDFSISLGAIEFDNKLTDLNSLLKFADQQQYVEKRKFHDEEKTDVGRI